MPTLKLARNLELPLDAVTRATAIVGQRGTGKTSTAVVFVEEAAAAGAHFAVIDPTGAWYGLTSNAKGDGPGLDCVVMGGHNGDVPLEPESGALVARLVVEERYSVVLDLEKMTKAKQVRFVAEFAEELYHRNRVALTLVMDEAHRFVPQQLREPGGFGARCLGAVTDVVTLGRRKGLGAVLVSQRPAKINKDVFEQAEIMVVHRLMGPNDRKAIAGWLDDSGAPPDALNALPTLEQGQAVVYAPTWPDVSRSARIRPKRTFDSSATPEIGGEVVLPAKRSDIDLTDLEKRMAATLERAREDDPKALREQLAKARERDGKLQLILDACATTGADPFNAATWQNAEPDAGMLAEEFRRGWGAALDHAHFNMSNALSGARERTHGAIEELDAAFARIFEQDGAAGTGAPPDAKAVQTGTAATPPAEGARPRGQGSNGAGRAPSAPFAGSGNAVAAGGSREQPVVLKAGARRMLDVLARYSRLTRPELSTLARVAKGGTLSDYLSALRTQAFIEEDENGITLTEAGETAAGPAGPPFTAAEVVAFHTPKLKAGARRMLDIVMRAPDQGFTRAELGRLANVAKGGTFSDYLSTLRTRGLVVERAKRVYPSPTLYLRASAVPGR